MTGLRARRELIPSPSEPQTNLRLRSQARPREAALPGRCQHRARHTLPPPPTSPEGSGSAARPPLRSPQPGPSLRRWRPRRRPGEHMAAIPRSFPPPARVVWPEPRGRRELARPGRTEPLRGGGRGGEGTARLPGRRRRRETAAGNVRARWRSGGERKGRGLGNAFFPPPLNNERCHWAGPVGSAQANGEQRVRPPPARVVAHAQSPGRPSPRVSGRFAACVGMGVIPQSHGITE